MLKTIFRQRLVNKLLIVGILASTTPAFAQNGIQQSPNAFFYNPFATYSAAQQSLSMPNETGAGANKNTSGVAHPSSFPNGRPTINCIVQAAEKRNIPVDLMLGVQSVERGETGQQMRNTNATYDLGAFQINTIHLPRIRGLGGSETDVLKKGCYNAEIASLLLSEALTHPKKQGYDFYTRASGYHSWTPKHNANYRKKLIQYTKQWQNWMRHNNMAHLIKAPSF